MADSGLKESDVVVCVLQEAATEALWGQTGSQVLLAAYAHCEARRGADGNHPWCFRMASRPAQVECCAQQ